MLQDLKAFVLLLLAWIALTTFLVILALPSVLWAIPGEAVLVEASKGWSGPEAVLIGLLAAGVAVALWLGLRGLKRLDGHEQSCEERTVRLYDAINRVQEQSNAADQRIEDKLDTIIPMIHRIDERTAKEGKP